MPDNATFQFGGSTFPLATGPGSLLSRADPALYHALAFFQSVIQTHCGDAWDAAASAAGLDGYVVGSAYPYNPEPDLQAGNFVFPLLAVYRTKARYSERTIHNLEGVDAWVIDYILPPLSPGQTEQLFPILHSVEATLVDRAQLGYDPFYLNGVRVFGRTGVASISSIRPLDRDFPLLNIQGETTSMTFRMLSMTFEVIESQTPLYTSFEPLEGVDGYVSVSNVGETDFPLIHAVVNNED